MVVAHRSRLATMAEATRAPEQRRRPFAGFVEELVSEILLRLPPRSILRCRVVCKAWRRITSDRAFLLAHHRRQPPHRLLSFVRDVGAKHNLGILSFDHDVDARHNLDVLDYCLEGLDLHTHQLRSVVRFTDNDFSAFDDSPFKVHAACDGLLLMSYHTRLYLCNPATRQWCSVFPPSLQHDTVIGLYAHGPSGEYRVGYYRGIGKIPYFLIKTVGSEKERDVWPKTSSASVRKWLWRGSEATKFEKRCLFYGNLHWLLRWALSYLLVFDTVAEVFRWMCDPAKIRVVASLLEMEGTLAMSNSHMGASEVDLWLLQGYKSTVWVHKYWIELPVVEIRRFDEYGKSETDWSPEVVSPEGDVLVDVIDWLLHYDIKGNMLQKFYCDGRLLNFIAQRS